MATNMHNDTGIHIKHFNRTGRQDDPSNGLVSYTKGIIGMMKRVLLFSALFKYEKASQECLNSKVSK